MQKAAIALPRTAPFLVLAAVAVVLLAAFVFGREERARLEAAETAASEQEDLAFCGSLWVVPVSGTHAICMTGLSEVRRRQRERFDREAVGL